jgi:hypothetical protein
VTPLPSTRLLEDVKENQNLKRQFVTKRDDDGGATGAVIFAGEEPTLPDGGDDDVQFAEPQSDGVTDEVAQAFDRGTLDLQVLWADGIHAGDLDLPVTNGPGGEETDLIDVFNVPIGEDGNEMALVERREEFVERLNGFNPSNGSSLLRHLTVGESEDLAILFQSR